jgi:hypothetical protein
MKQLTWSDLTLPPINLVSLPNWLAHSTKEETMDNNLTKEDIVILVQLLELVINPDCTVCLPIPLKEMPAKILELQNKLQREEIYE